jgi:hypothetical protein
MFCAATPLKLAASADIDAFILPIRAVPRQGAPRAGNQASGQSGPDRQHRRQNPRHRRAVREIVVQIEADIEESEVIWNRIRTKVPLTG